jgi:hypothetical protein
VLSFIPAFRACQVKNQHGGSVPKRAPQTQTSCGLTLRLTLLIGATCLPIGVGCRSNTPTDWIGEHVAISRAWQGQPATVRNQDASFQEGWRSGFQDGLAHPSTPDQAREPAQFEAYMNSKREAAVTLWRRGYDSGFEAAAGKPERHQAHTDLFPAATLPTLEGTPAESLSSAPPATLFAPSQPLPRLPYSEIESAGSSGGASPPEESPAPVSLPLMLPALPDPVALPSPLAVPIVASPTIVASPPSVGPTIVASPPSGDAFEDAVSTLDSAIKKNGDPVALPPVFDSSESPAIAPPATFEPGPPTESPADSKPDSAPDAAPSIQELPLDDDDVADRSQPQTIRSTASVLDSASHGAAGPVAADSDSAAVVGARLTAAKAPLDYQGRLQTGHVVSNPYVTSETAAAAPAKAPAPPTSTPPTPAVLFLGTRSGDFQSTLPIATNAPELPARQVNLETSATESQPASAPKHVPSPVSSHVPSHVPTHLPKGLPLQPRKVNY